MTRTLVKLGEICQQDRQSIKPGQRTELPYIGLECIESGTGLLRQGAMSKTPKSPQANSFGFDQRHVLYGKLRPYLNKVALPDACGKCSTEIIPLLPSERVDRGYLAYFLRTQATVDNIKEKVSGARMPRADMGMVLALDVPLPPIPEQRRIVDRLTRAEGIVRLRREAAVKAADLIPAIFIDMFGDPESNPKNWPMPSLGQLIIGGPTNGLYKHKSAYGRGIPILRIDAFYEGVVRDLSLLKRLEVNADEAQRFALHEDDIVVNRVNSPEYLGKSALIPRLTEPTVFESNMMRFAVDTSRVMPRYVIAYLQTAAARAHFLSNAKHAINQSSINQQDVKTLPIFEPAMPLQLEFKRQAEAAESIIAQQVEAMTKAQATFNALLAQAFSPSSTHTSTQE